MKLKIGVMGSALERGEADIPIKGKKLAFEVGKAIAKNNCIFINGACGGLPELAAKGLEGFIPISIYPRMDFLICAMDQLVNHLDKASQMSDGQFRPGVIIRTAVGSTAPLMPGPQHCQDHSFILDQACDMVQVIELDDVNDVYSEYEFALEQAKKGISTILVEYPDLYNKDMEAELIESRKQPLIK